MGTIYRCNLDGSNVESFLDVSSSDGISGLAAGAGYVYYTPYTTKTLDKIKSDGTDHSTLYIGTTYISDVVLDLANSYLFFVRTGDGGFVAYTIYRSDLNGGSRTGIYSTTNNYFIGYVSAGNGYVFFTLGNNFNELRIDNNGANFTTAYTIGGGGSVSHGAYDDTNKNLYFTYLNNIYKGGADGTGAVVIKDAGVSLGGSNNLAAAPNVLLPVELTSFSAQQIDNTVKLIWQTATEVNNYGFEVERRETQDVRSETWEKIGFVQGSGTTNSPKNYEFADSELPNSDEVSYRLKQIDNDGTSEYSKVVTVDLSNITSVEDELNYKFALEQNYPNPFNPTTSIKYQVASIANVTLTVYNILGRQVAILVNEQKSPGKYVVQFDGSNLSSGMYFYKLTSGEYTQTRKLMLLR